MCVGGLLLCGVYEGTGQPVFSGEWGSSWKVTEGDVCGGCELFLRGVYDGTEKPILP